jgi:TIR domain
MAKFDLFVSYAHEQDPQWANLLVNELESRVSTLLGSTPKFYFDPQMEQGVNVTTELVEKVQGSRLLLVVLSPKYLNSDWCKKELCKFLDAGGDTADHRVFVVESERIDRETWPEQLRDKETMVFWQENPVNKIPARLNPNLKNEYDTFIQRVWELAHFIHQRLQASNNQPPTYKGDVWIAEPTDDLVNEWEELAGAVRQEGWRVLPASPYPTGDLDVYTKAVREHLNSAQLFVQLLGPNAGKRPAWSPLPYPMIQANEVRDVLKERYQVRWLRWRTTAAPPAEDKSPYADLLRDGDVQQSRFGDFKSEVIRKLTLPEGPLLSSRPPASANDEVKLYVHNDAVDRTLADEVIYSLENLDVLTVRLPGVEPGKTISDQYREILKDCHGVVLVYGLTPMNWAWTNCGLLRKIYESPGGPIGVLNGPPPSTPRVELRGRRVIPLDCTGGVDTTVLEGFVKQVRQQAFSGNDRA